MKVLTYHDRRGPAVVFLPPKGDALPESAAAPDDGVKALSAHAYSQVAARGSKATWEQHCENLVKSAPYAGRWTMEEVPDGSSPRQALRHVRQEFAMGQFSGVDSGQPSE